MPEPAAGLRLRQDQDGEGGHSQDEQSELDGKDKVLSLERESPLTKGLKKGSMVRFVAPGHFKSCPSRW